MARYAQVHLTDGAPDGFPIERPSCSLVDRISPWVAARERLPRLETFGIRLLEQSERPAFLNHLEE